MNKTAIHDNHQPKVDIRLEVQKKLFSRAKAIAEISDYLKSDRAHIFNLMSYRKNEAKIRTFISLVYEDIKEDGELSRKPALHSILLDTCERLDYWFCASNYEALIDTFIVEIDEFVASYFPEVKRSEKAHCWRRIQLPEIQAQLMKLELHAAFMECICSDNLSALSDPSLDDTTAFEYICNTLISAENTLSTMVNGLKDFNPDIEATGLEISFIAAQTVRTRVIVRLMIAVLSVSALTFIAAVLELILSLR